MYISKNNEVRLYIISKIKSLSSEFKTFAIRGNVIDMSVGIVIGAAFTSIVNSFVADILMPPLGWVMGKVDFSNLYLTLPVDGKIIYYPSLEAAKSAGAVTINYGVFINACISFMITAFAVFLLIKSINKLRSKIAKEESTKAETKTKECMYCFSTVDIRAKKCPFCTSDLQ